MALPSNPNSFPSDLSLPKSTPDNCPKINEDTKASYKGLIITPLTEEIHTTIFRSLGDKQDLTEFCETKIQFRKDIKETSVENKIQILHTQALRDAVRMNSVFGNRYASALMKTGVTLPKEELPQVLREVLREVLRTYSSAGITNIKHLFEMGATLPEEELEQFLPEFMSEALREAQKAPPVEAQSEPPKEALWMEELRRMEAPEKDSGVEIATVNNQYATLVSILVEMGAKLPEKKKVQFLREALKINSAVGNKLVDILVTRMETTLPKKELSKRLENVLKMFSMAGLNNASHLVKMGGTLTEKRMIKFLVMALRTSSAAGNNMVDFLLEMEATLTEKLTEQEKAQFLREALRMNSAAGNNHVHALRRKMGAKLPYEELAQFLHEAFRMNSAAGNNHVHALRDMGAKLSDEKLAQFLHEAFRMNSAAGNNHVHALRDMGAKLSDEKLAQFLREAFRMNSAAGNNYAHAWREMGS